MSFKRLKQITESNRPTLVIGNEDMGATEVTIPVNEEAVVEPVGTGTNVSTDEVNRYYVPAMNISELPECNVAEVTNYAPNTQKPTNYCPVFIHIAEDSSMHITAYITGPIKDIPFYVDLIDLLELMGEKDTITIFIDSPGGLVVSGAAIASAIDNCEGTTEGVAVGLCASAGSLIWSACDKCSVGELAVLMYHNSSHMDMGNSADIRDRAANQVRYVADCLLAVALKKGHVTRDEYDSILQSGKDVYISAEQMVTRLHPTGGTHED